MTQPAAASGQRALLWLAAVAVAFAAADTYVVVMALPDMMAGAGLSIAELQKAAPIVSGFLLGYVAMLPLIGRIADLSGRIPVLVISLIVFAFGSLITALAYDMPSMVLGRFFQGVGGGGLVPATLALVADLYPAEKRGVPLGVVSAVQELGSVLGPLFGAAVLALADWRAIFAINLAVGLVLAAAIRGLAGAEAARLRPPGTAPPAPPPGRRLPDLVGLLLLLTALVAAAIAMIRPPDMMRDITIGAIFVPYAGSGRWLTPIGLITAGAALAFVLWCWFARRPLLRVRDWVSTLRSADLLGALLLGVALGGVILAFATADPEIQVFAPAGKWYLLGSLVAVALLVVHLRRASNPLIPPGAVAEMPAWGALVVSFFVGASLIAALIDIPLFARTTIYRDSQLQAALVLVRFLIALPVGAVLGGHLLRRVNAGVITALGMAAAAVGFWWMTRWDATSLESWTATIPLVLAGLGFGLALAPVNAALLAATDAGVHGVASALVVVARMVGMLIGISALTTLGLRSFYAAPDTMSPLERAIAQEHTVFAGAAGCALLAGVCALVFFRAARTKDVDPAATLRSAG